MTLHKILRSIAIGLLFLVPIFPLIVANDLFFPFITGKAFYFRILVELIFACWIILCFLDAKYRPKMTPLAIAITAFTLVALAADLIGVNPIRSLWSNNERMEGWITIIHLWAFFIAATNIFGAGQDGKRWWHRWFNMSLGVALIVAIYGIFQLFGWAAIHQSAARLDASLGNAEYLASYMLFSAFLAAYLFFVARRKEIANWAFLQWAYPILSALFIFIIFESQTRGTVLGVVGGAMLALALYAIFGKAQQSAIGNRYRWICGGIIGAIILLGVLFWFNRTNPIIANSAAFGRLASISLSELQTQGRAYIWPMAVQGWLQSPHTIIAGWGQENFNYVFNTHYNPKMWSQEQWFDRAHDVYLDWLIDGGVIALIAYLSIYVLFLMGIWKSSLTIAEKSVFTGLLAGYAVHNLFVFDNLASYVLFFSVLGFAAALHEGKALAWLGTAPFRMDAVEYIVAPATVIVLAAGIYFFNVRPIEANIDLIAGLQSCQGSTPDVSGFEKALAVNAYVANQEIREQILSCGGSVITSQAPDPTKEAFYELAQQAILAQVAATPKDARIYALGGSFLNQIGSYSAAEQLLTTAHTLSPGKQSIDLELATDYLNDNQMDQAVALLKEAYESATDDTEVAQAYATVLVADNQAALAHQIFGNDPTIFDTPELANYYMGAKQYAQAIAIYQALLVQTPGDVNTEVGLAQAQYAAGMVSAAVATMKSIESAHPEYTQQIEAAITQMQAGK